MQFKLIEILKLFDWLDMPLKGEDIIVRHRFLKDMYDINQQSLKEKQEIFENACNKDENGEPIVTPSLKYDIPKDKMEDVEALIKDIDEKEIWVDINPLILPQVVALLKDKLLRGLTIAEAKYYDDVITKLKG
jgi:biotin synthase-like enzyme